MNIEEMHVWFRQYAQQMGMQNVRAILPEQIDLLINTSIIDVVNQTIIANIASTNDRVITDNSKLGQINSLRTLYKVKECNCVDDNDKVDFSIPYQGSESSSFKISIKSDSYKYEGTVQATGDTVNTAIAHKFAMNCFDIFYDRQEEATHYLTFKKYLGVTKITIVNETTNKVIVNKEFDINPRLFIFNEENYFNGKLTTNPEYIFPKFMFYVDFSLNYIKTDTGYRGDGSSYENIVISNNNKFVTNIYPVRLIDDAFLADTLNDFVLKNRLRSPILVTNNNNFELYIDRFVRKNGYFRLNNDLIPYKFRISYIAKPVEVRYAEDVNGVNVDCDLPEHMHITVLKHAVDLYRDSLSNGLSTAQQQEQAQQRENARNNYRNDANQ